MSLGVIASHASGVTSSAYVSAVMADTPLFYGRMGDLSGLTMTDSSGNAHNGSYASGITLGATGLVAGDTDTAVDFDGTHDATVPNGSWMNVSTFSVDLLFFADTLQASSFNFLVSREANGTIGPFWFAVQNRKLTFSLWTGGSASPTSITGTTTLSTGTKYHVGCTYDGANMKVFLNGTQDGTGAKTGTPNSTSEVLHIGAWYQNTSHVNGLYFDGRIDEVALYGSALSGTRMAAHAAAA